MSKKVVHLHEIVRLCDDPSTPAPLREDLRHASTATIKYNKAQGLLRLKASIMERTRSPPGEATRPPEPAGIGAPGAGSLPSAIAQTTAMISIVSVNHDRNVFESRPLRRRRARVVAAAAAALIAMAAALASGWFSPPRGPLPAISMRLPVEHARRSARGLSRLVRSAGVLAMLTRDYARAARSLAIRIVMNKFVSDTRTGSSNGLCYVKNYDRNCKSLSPPRDRHRSP